MKRVLALVSFVCLLSGCLMNRSATFSSPPGPLPFTRELQTEPLDRSWAIGEIFVKAEYAGGTQQSAADWSQARVQIEERLADTLRQQTTLGRRVDDRKSAELVVDLNVEVKETHSVNGWLAAALASEAAIVVACAGAGAAVGAASASSNKQEAAAGGAVIGALISIVPAVLVPLAFPATDVLSTADARLTFRRASDGVVIYEKQTRTSWHEKHNVYGVEGKLARMVGSLTESLEREVVVALYAGLRASPPVPVVQADGLSGPAFFAADAPREIRYLPVGH